MFITIASFYEKALKLIKRTKESNLNIKTYTKKT